MSVFFEARCLPEHVEVRLLSKRLLGQPRPIEPEQWKQQPEPVASLSRTLSALVSSDDARWSGVALEISNKAASKFHEVFARSIGLPAIAPVLLDISFHRSIGDPTSSIRLEWRDAHYRPIVPARSGVAIGWDRATWRLAGPLYDLTDAIEAFNAIDGVRTSERVIQWAIVKSALAQVTGVDTDEYTRNLTVFQAGSFALDISESRGGIDFKPVLMSRAQARSLEDNAPTEEPDDLESTAGEAHRERADLADEEASALLVSEDSKSFWHQFDQAAHADQAYVLRRNTYLVIDPDLKQALEVVKRKRRCSEEEKREFIKNPKVAIAREMDLVGGSPQLQALFVETKQYSDRVVGLGLWERPQLPWLQKESVEWLPEKFPAKVSVDGVEYKIEREEAELLRAAVDQAEQSSASDVDFREERVPLEKAKRIVDQIDGQASRDPAEHRTAAEERDPAAEEDSGGRMVVKIKTNYEGVEYEIGRVPRRTFIALTPPDAKMGGTKFKTHQLEGYRWLVNAWKAGWPGVLLADDMGLGKTFQALAFLAWLRENREASPRGSKGRPSRGPVLVVAPTALLENWIEEIGKHLAEGALGNMARLFGSDLRRFKAQERESIEPLDVAKMPEFDVLLTTYETLADNHTSFAKIGYSVALFDEMQKIKDPGTLNTLASKAMNADFVLGLTGTPVENRIEDLWSIMDRIFPGYLRDLKSFSRDYKDFSEEKFRALKDRLSNELDGAPAIMLRRMKEDVLEGLPPKEIRPYRTTMPKVQCEAYDAAVAGALSLGPGSRSRGAMLEAIQRLRSVSLYPDDPWRFDLSTEKGCREWIERSARLAKTMEILRDIDRRGEKALVFVEHRFMQERFAEAATTLFGLDELPFIINGATPGGQRQKRVNQFQARRSRFDLMILSPKAAGVGLTITAANHVIHLSRWWNPAVEDQCNDRVYRIGQNKSVQIHIPMAEHPVLGERTFDVTLDRLLTRKRALSRTLLAPPITDSDLGDVYREAVDVRESA